MFPLISPNSGVRVYTLKVSSLSISHFSIFWCSCTFISISHYLLQYIQIHWLYIDVVLYPATWLNLVLLLVCMCVGMCVRVCSFRYYVHQTTTLSNRDHFTSSFPTWAPFVSLLCFFCPGQNLRRCGECGHQVSLPDLRGEQFSLLLLSMMSAVGYS